MAQPLNVLPAGFTALWKANNIPCVSDHIQVLFIHKVSLGAGLLSYVSLFLNPGTSLIAQPVKNLPAVQETPVRSLGREDPLEEEIATHSSILAW